MYAYSLAASITWVAPRLLVACPAFAAVRGELGAMRRQSLTCCALYAAGSAATNRHARCAVIFTEGQRAFFFFADRALQLARARGACKTQRLRHFVRRGCAFDLAQYFVADFAAHHSEVLLQSASGTEACIAIEARAAASLLTSFFGRFCWGPGGNPKIAKNLRGILSKGVLGAIW